MALPLLLAACNSDEGNLLESPDGSIRITQRDSRTGPWMLISVDGRPFMDISRMGLTFTNGTVFMTDSIVRTAVDTTYTLPWGENKVVRDHYNELLVCMSHGQDSSCTRMNLRIRVYDEGVAFRYEYLFCSADTAGCLLLCSEGTQFHFADDGTCWSIPANFESYEFAYREQPISQAEDANTPFTFKVPTGRQVGLGRHRSLYGSIHEANLRDMPEMTLERRDSLTLGARLAPSADSSIGYNYRLLSDTAVSSWRTISIGRKAVDLINNNLILNLNEPCALDSPEQYRPIKYVGIWWGMHLGINSWTPDSRHGATTENAMRYIDFAAANDVDAVLFEGWNRGWEQWGGTQVFDFTHAAPDFDAEAVVAYAKEKGVQLIVHHETGGNIPNYEAQMEEAYDWCRDHGIRYVKTGYAGGFPNREIHHSRYGVQHYAHAMRRAASHGLALDVHEPIKPTGLRRTYPNLMTGEGARGMEWNAWSDGNPPSHQVTLPFTRLLAGPMDYTPGIFDITYERIKDNPECRQWNGKDARQCRVHTTLAKQCALWVILYSPMVMAADLIENYEGHPMFQFFRDYNPDCDWSCALDGEPGQYVVLVRRAGGTYYLGAATNEEPRDLVVPLRFLEGKGKYTATVYADGADADYGSNPTAYSISTEQVSRRGKLRLHLAAGGGAAVVIKPKANH